MGDQSGIDGKTVALVTGLVVALGLLVIVVVVAVGLSASRAKPVAPEPAAQPDIDAMVDGSTRLMEAVNWGRDDEAMRLLQQGADPNIICEMGPGLPLACALAGEDARMVRALLEHGADPNLKDRKGFPPMHMALTREMVNLLIEYGADPDARYTSFEGDVGETALHNAALVRSPELVDVLIRAGADINALDGQGMSALDWAVLGSEADPYGPMTEEERADYIRRGGPEMLRMMEQYRVEANARYFREAEQCRQNAEVLRAHGGKTAAELERR